MGNAVVKYWPRKSLTLCSSIGVGGFNEVGWQYDGGVYGHPISLSDVQKKVLIRAWFYLTFKTNNDFPKLVGHAVYSRSMAATIGNGTQVLYSPMIDVGTSVYQHNIFTYLSPGHNAEIYNVAGPWDGNYTTPGLCSVISRWWAGDFWWGNFNCALSYYTDAPKLLDILNSIGYGVCTFRARFDWSWPWGNGTFYRYGGESVNWFDIQSASSGERDYWTSVSMQSIEVSFDGSNWHYFARTEGTSSRSAHQSWTMGGQLLD